MEKQIVWLIEGEIREGQKSGYETVMNEMISEVAKEDGSMNYEWTIAQDGKTINIYERYKDEGAVMQHLGTWQRFQERFFAVTDITNFTVYSEVSPQLQEILAGMNPTYMRPIGGYARA